MAHALARPIKLTYHARPVDVPADASRRSGSGT